MASTLTIIVWAGLVLIGPPVLLFWLIRRRRRRERAPPASAALAAAPAPLATAPAAPDARKDTVERAQTGNPYAFPYGMPLVAYPILAIALASVRKNVWMTAMLVLLLAALALAFARLAFNPPDFEKARIDDPTLNRATWRINWLLFFAAPPAVLTLFGAAQLWLFWAAR